MFRRCGGRCATFTAPKPVVRGRAGAQSTRYNVLAYVEPILQGSSTAGGRGAGAAAKSAQSRHGAAARQPALPARLRPRSAPGHALGRAAAAAAAAATATDRCAM